MITKMTLRPGLFRELETEIRKKLVAEQVVERIGNRDHTLWKPSPAEIANRLGWLASPGRMLREIDGIAEFVDGVRADGYDFVLLLGMGGSSLAPEVFRKVFGVAAGYLNLEVMDSTDPRAIISYAACLDFKKTLFVVSTKSGGTVETFSLMKYFYNLTAEKLGEKEAGRHFLAITDPGSALESVAREHNFRHLFLNDPEIGGRYSALSFFGMVPAMLLGMDGKILLERAAAAVGEESAENGHAALFGALLGELALRGRDKLTFVFSQRLAPLGDWIEQLVAESTGKEGKGILPVLGEPFGVPELYGDDRVFCSIRLAKEADGEAGLRAQVAAGHPVCDLVIADSYDLGAHLFFWEMATAAAGWRLSINPFDQPDVEAAKILARKMITQYRQQGAMPEEKPVVASKQYAVYGGLPVNDPEEALPALLEQALPSAYAAMQVWMAPTPWLQEELRCLRGVIMDRFHLPTTVGYGPRFLHSTGQLHKGDAGKGLFVQFTADDQDEVAVPEELGRPASTLSFGVLKQAQAFGDRQALREAGRKTVRIHLHGDPARGIARLTAFVEKKAKGGTGR